MQSGSPIASERITSTALLDQCVFYSGAKLSRKQTGRDRSLLRLTAKDKPDLILELEHDSEKDYPSGGYSLKVKRGYLPAAFNPQLAVKYTSPKQFRSDRIRMLYTAARGAFFQRMLGRTGEVAVYADMCLQITDWYQGCTLKKNQMTILSLEKRLSYMTDLVSELAMLHQYNLVHGDIKPRNIMVTATSAHIIDLEGVRFIDETDLAVMHTLSYLDEANRQKKFKRLFQSNHLDRQSDVYALGLSLGSMFPEFFEVISRRGVVNGVEKIISHQLELNDSLCSSHLPPHHKHLIQLIFSMVDENTNFRPRSACEVLVKLGKLGLITKIQAPDSADNRQSEIRAIKKDLFTLKVRTYLIANSDQPVNLESFIFKHTIETIDEIAILFNEFPLDQCDVLLSLPALRAYLTSENFITCMSLMPAEKRMNLMCEFPGLVQEIPLESFENSLKAGEMAFVKMRSRMVGLLESYTRVRVKFHDERVQFMLSQLRTARCVDDVYTVINANCSSPHYPISSVCRYADRGPTYTLFSVGYEHLIKKCFKMIDDFRRTYREPEAGAHVNISRFN